MKALALLVLFAPGTDPVGVKYFEDKIRPVLVEHCYECHSAPKKTRGGLALDTREGLLVGGDSGPALVAGKPTESLLIKALRHDELAMPPKGKLPDAVIADFEQWILRGAPDPRGVATSTAKSEIDIAEGRKFWSFRPPRRHPVPPVADAAWPLCDIDRFIRAAQERQGVAPVRDADREVWLRRVTIDLTGLPPTPEEIDNFVNDPSAGAHERVVDRLLASPHFGERWGRHWLDVARYADSNGKDENLTFHDAWRYRDWVIDAVNRDLPFDEFVRTQIAGDLLPADDPARRDERLVASGFLVVGPKVLADRDTDKRKMDVVDEQIDTVGRAILGMTLGCARCHDHKFDPIPTADYYALAGIFASTRTLDGFKLGNPIVSGWALRPLGSDGEEKLAVRKAHQKRLTELTNQIKKAKADLKTVEDKANMRVPAKLVGFTVDDDQAELVGFWKESTFTQPYVGRGYRHNDRAGPGEKSARFRTKLPKSGEYEVYVSYTSGNGRATDVPVTVRHAGGEARATVDQSKSPKIDGLFHKVGQYPFAADTQAEVVIGTADTRGHVIIDAVRFVPAGELGRDPEMAMGVPEEVRAELATTRERLAELEAREKEWRASAPPEPPMAMAPRDEESPGPVKIHVRGNPHQLGAEVPRGWLSVTDDACRPAIAAGESGRRELADWLVSPTNPLTARVFVNRIWHHLFGFGLVRTVDNFGTQGDRPTHPELLDQLAVEFVEDGWSLKRLVRRIVLSRTYRLACDSAHPAAAVDPENRLLWRANRRRVEGEVIRDAILQAAGTLDRTMGGSAVASLGERAIDNDSKGGLPVDANTRRSVYLPIIRNDLPPILEVFDFADPDVSTGARDATTVAAQALFLMNSPFVHEQAKRAAARLVALPDDTARVTELYRLALGRKPTAAEVDRVLAFVGDDAKAWPAVCAAVFGCTEFRFVE